jgi:hypothetical protein
MSDELHVLHQAMFVFTNPFFPFSFLCSFYEQSTAGGTK